MSFLLWDGGPYATFLAPSIDLHRSWNQVKIVLLKFGSWAWTGQRQMECSSSYVIKLFLKEKLLLGVFWEGTLHLNCRSSQSNRKVSVVRFLQHFHFYLSSRQDVKQQWVAATKVPMPFAFGDTRRWLELRFWNHDEGSGISCYHPRAPQEKVVLFQPTLPGLMSKKLM